MTTTITLELRADDAEPILREAAYKAARYGAYLDHFTRRTVAMPHRNWRGDYDKEHAVWTQRFLAAKRIVEAFGAEVEATSEAETLTVYIPDKVLKSHIVTIAGFRMRHIDKSVPDPKNARPEYRREVHTQACHAAADRVVRRWRALVEEEA